MTQARLFDDKLPVEAPQQGPPKPRLAQPKAIQLLLPVWGERYIDQFLEFCLPTLLAPGNIPALAKALPCKFVFLTSSEGEKNLRAHPGIRYLDSYCTVETQVIDDLITGDNHSTTITLAFERAVRAAGAEILNTCFFFLISDYLMADGSLASVLKRMQAGASGVLAGNFQVVEQDAIKTFHMRFDRGRPDIAIPPRELVDWALNHLHAMTAANTVNFSLSRSSHSNRLFWRVDDDTLLGRFYLMHMICIRPDIADFVIGASCDYSFIPEMCPSGKIEALTDSDDYLVVEMQPREHETDSLRLGRIDAKELALSLSQWTTAQHRENAKYQIVFHARDVPSTAEPVTREAEAFVAEIRRHLSRMPQPSRDHPYWVGAIVAHRWSVQHKLGIETTTSTILREYKPTIWLVERLRDICFGRVPSVKPWHPLWPDYQAAEELLHEHLADTPGRLLLISPSPVNYTKWASERSESMTNLQVRKLLTIGVKEYMPLVGSFDVCLLMLSEFEMEWVSDLIERIRPLLAAGGHLIVFATCGRALANGPRFCGQLTRYSGRFLDRTMPLEQTYFIAAGRLRSVMAEALVRLYAGMIMLPLLYYPIAALFSPLLVLGSLLGNVRSKRPRVTPPKWGTCTSAIMVLKALTASRKLPNLTSDTDIETRPDRYRVKPSRLVEHLWQATRN